MSHRGKTLAKAALAATTVALLMLAALVYGVVSVRRQNRAYRFVRYLLQQQGKLDPKREASLKQGIWHKAGAHPDGAASRQPAADDLAALPYLAGYTAAPGVKDVTVHDEAAAYNGLNFVLSAHAPSAALTDMKGKVLHEWRKDFASVWPEPRDPASGNPVYKTYWRRAKPMANGDLLAMFMDFGLLRLDRNSKLLWAYAGRTHHDMFEGPGGEVYVLTRELRNRNDLGLESWRTHKPILEEFITVLSPAGKEVRKISLLDCFLNSAYAPMLESIKEGDVFHANTIRPIQVERPPLFKNGQILVSLRNIHTLAVVDPDEKKVTWAATGMWKYQHEPRLLNNGDVLLFDNRGDKGRSQALQFNPLTQQMVWSYKGFYSREAGSLQRLANGNTLITESEKGRGLEVTPSGQIVWEFYNPHRAGEKQDLIAALYDVIRLAPSEVAWLSDANANAKGGASRRPQAIE